MNNRRKIRLEMPEPCTANFEQMPDVGHGRFCKRCNKTVHDVSGLPDGALQVFLKSPESICMQLHEDQLGRNINLNNQLNRPPALYNISVCMIHDLMPGSILGISQQDDIVHENKWFTGFLIDKTNYRPLAHALISAGKLGITFSDDSGWFRFFIPDDIAYGIVTFSVSINTHTDNYQEILKQLVQITPSKVQVRNNTALSYHPFTKPTSVKISKAYTFIQTSA